MNHRRFLKFGTIFLLTMACLGGVGQASGTGNYPGLHDLDISRSGTPDPFNFRDKFDVEPQALVVSEPRTITGLTNPAVLTIKGGSYAINEGEYSTGNGTVRNMDQIRVRLRAPSGYGLVNYSDVSIGGVEAHFAMRTRALPGTGWEEVPGILENIQKPVFPDLNFYITDFGAVGDGVTRCTNAFKNAISACHESGGGKVIVPEGTFYTGPIHLASNVNLDVSEHAVIKFSTDPGDYLPVVYTRFEGTECYNYSPLIYAFEQENIAITGQGTLDGQADDDHWWPWKRLQKPDQSALRIQAEEGVPVEQRVYGPGHYLRPAMIQTYRCNNILIDGVTILNGPFWHIHPVLGNNITVRNITVIGHGPNNDGCNPESCKNVLIENCFFETGDDCITIKSGRNADGRLINVPTENVVVRRCTMKDGYGGLVIGSEISGGARNIFAEDCYMGSSNLRRVLRIKTNSIRGGLIENIYLRNITVGQVKEAAICITFDYGEGDIADFEPVVRNVEVKDMTCQKSPSALRFYGYERSPIRNIRLINCNFANTNQPNQLTSIRNLCLNNVTFEGWNRCKILKPFVGTLFVSSTATPGTVNEKDSCTLHITVKTTGDLSVEGVVVHLLLPAELSAEYVSKKLGGVEEAEMGEIFFEIHADLAGTYLIPIVVTADNAEGTSTTQTVNVLTPPQLSMTASFSPSTIKEDESTTLTVGITNTGEQTAEDVKITIILPTGLSMTHPTRTVGDVRTTKQKTFAITGDAPGTYSITVLIETNAESETTTIPLVVEEAPSPETTPEATIITFFLRIFDTVISNV